MFKNWHAAKLMKIIKAKDILTTVITTNQAEIQLFETTLFLIKNAFSFLFRFIFSYSIFCVY